MDVETTPRAFPLHRERAWSGFGAALIVATCLLIAFLLLSGPWRWVMLTLFALMATLTVLAGRQLKDKRAPLEIGAGGLLYRPFSDRVVPWSAITDMAFMRSHARSVAWGKATWRRQPVMDQINFAVADLAPYPMHPGRALSRGMQRLGNLPPIAIQVGLLTASAEDILAEIRKHRPGDVRVVENYRVPSS